MLFLKKSIRSGAQLNLLDLGNQFQVGTMAVAGKNLVATLGIGNPDARYSAQSNSGSGMHLINGINAQSAVNNASCYIAPQNQNYALKTYFDSVLGATAGNRYIARDSCVAKVLIDGSLQPLAAASPSLNGDSWIFAETTTKFLVLTISRPNNNGVAANYVSSVDKSTGASTTLYSSTGGGASGGDYYTQYAGKFGQFHVFNYSGHSTYSSAPTASSGNYVGYIIVDSTALTAKFVYQTLEGNGNHNTVMSQPYASADGTMQYALLARGGTVLGQPIRVWRTSFKTAIAYADAIIAKQEMTIVGAPADFVANATHLGSTGCYHEMATYTFTDNGARYVAVSMHAVTSGNSTHTVPYASLYGMWLFKLESDGTTLTYKSKVSYGKEISSVLPTSDGKKWVVAKAGDSVSVVRFNSGAETLSISDTVNVFGLQGVSIDALDNVYTYALDSDVRGGQLISIFSISNSATVSAKFDVAQIIWDGTPVTCNILLSAFDAFGARTARTVNVLIDGAVFTSGGGTLQQFTTTINGDLVIPITINAAGPVSVVPELI